MPVTLINTEDYEDVRRALDLSTDDEILPDDTIGSQIFAVAAQAEVLSRVPNYGGLSAEKQARVKWAAIYMTAAYIAPSMPDIIQEQLSAHRSYQRKSMDWPTRATELEADASREIALAISTGETRAAIPTFFSKAPGRC